MLLTADVSLLEEFARSAAAAKRKELWAIEDDRQQMDTRLRQDRREQKDWEAFEAAVLATTVEMTEFHDRLNHYGTATVTALMENETASTAVKAQLDEMRAQAFVLPDGRRVFKSDDGQHVFAEDGAALDHTVIDPDLIDGRRPTAESYLAARNSRDRLEQSRAELIEYQSRVDRAQEAVAGNNVSKNDLDALDADLKNNMPEAVKQHMGDTMPRPDLQESAPAAMGGPATTIMRPGGPSL